MNIKDLGITKEFKKIVNKRILSEETQKELKEIVSEYPLDSYLAWGKFLKGRSYLKILKKEDIDSWIFVDVEKDIYGVRSNTKKKSNFQIINILDDCLQEPKHILEVSKAEVNYLIKQFSEIEK